MSNTRNLFELISELELYTSAIDRDIDNYDVALSTISEIRSALEAERTMITMPNTTMIIMNYLDSIEERINERR